MTEKTVISSSITKSQAQTDNDNCSPLCACNCCGQPLVFLQRSLISDLPKPETKKLNEPEYKNKFTSGFFNSIWQPPKLILNLNG